MKQFYNIRMLCKAVNLHHSVYYYHKQNKENSYKKANEISVLSVQNMREQFMIKTGWNE